MRATDGDLTVVAISKEHRGFDRSNEKLGVLTSVNGDLSSMIKNVNLTVIKILYTKVTPIQISRNLYQIFVLLLLEHVIGSILLFLCNSYWSRWKLSADSYIRLRLRRSTSRRYFLNIFFMIFLLLFFFKQSLCFSGTCFDVKCHHVCIFAGLLRLKRSTKLNWQFKKELTIRNVTFIVYKWDLWKQLTCLNDPKVIWAYQLKVLASI